ncbi:Rab family GTPase [Nitratifractor sp.]|uniref:Rab family GTPase n=1 Tax=Nitratifractor sp. TaxID=2268144 RepID=UPI0025E11E5A|nr:Rab family GTPase [Nitratifractor sp.]
MIRKKILLLGDFHVGKTSLIRRYVDNAFSDDYLTTIGVKISKKALKVDGLDFELLIWDIEGATPVKKIPTHYFAGAAGAILVADLTRPETIKGLDEHALRFHAVNPKSVCVRAYNKVDLIPEESLGSIDIPPDTFLTSAKDDINVSLLFETLVRRIAS